MKNVAYAAGMLSAAGKMRVAESYGHSTIPASSPNVFRQSPADKVVDAAKRAAR
jgi:hypothetical protein